MPTEIEAERAQPVQPAAETAPEDELVPEDDRVIGTAFRWSLAVMIAIGIVVVGVVVFVNRQESVEPGVEMAVNPPVEVKATAEPPAVRFTDITDDAGIDYVHFTGATGEKLLPETMGGGGGFVDVDGDGDADIVFIGATSWPQDEAVNHPPSVVIYENQRAGRFDDATARLGLAATNFYGMGLAAADYDGDGRVDLFVTAVGRNRLFRNTQNGFAEVTEQAGVGGGADAWSSGAAFFDYDNDGDLDLFVCNYVKWSREIDFELDYRLTGVGRAYGPPANYEGTHPSLYRNEGDGTFADVSASAGIEVTNRATGLPIGKGLAVAVLDVDQDGWLDVLVANDTVQNFFFHNRGGGVFEESGEIFGLAYDRTGSATGAMGIDAGYYGNGDDVGFAIGNFANEMTSLYVSQGDPTLYADEAITAGIGAPTRTALSFGVLLLDYDLDGWLDLVQSNGHLEEEIGVVDPSQSYRQPAQLFWNGGNQAPRPFIPVATESLGDLATPIVGRGSTYADIDDDGDLDLLLFQVGGRPLLLRNDEQLGHHWLRLRLVGRGQNREAIGARVEVSAGGVTQRRTVSPNRSYLSQVELPLTFGLGDHETIDTVRITWPAGAEEEVSGVEVDRLQVVEQKG